MRGIKVCTDLGRWDNGERAHHAVGVLFADLGNQKGAHTRAGTTAEGVGNLETLKAVGALSFLADDIEDRVDELSSLGIILESHVSFPGKGKAGASDLRPFAQLLPAPD